MTINDESNLRVLRSWSEVPAFDSESAEAKFWLQHALEPKLMNGSILKGDARESATVTLRFDPRLLARLKRVARSRYLNYQSMIKQWLAERLEKENDS
jgi:predicted DNA binding CopG/RHH family protein